MNRYLNRKDAGKFLAQHLNAFANHADVLVLALPRGGVPVGYEIAKELKAPLDVFIVRKLGVPGFSELAMGAIAMGDVTVFNESIVKAYNVSPEQQQALIDEELTELKRRESLYRGSHTFPSLKGKTIILVDDGIATGASMRAAIKALRQLQPSKIVAAVPVADVEMCKDMKPLVDQFICPLQVKDFYAVGAWYEDFSQTEDAEVTKLLQEASKVLTSTK